MKIETTTIQTYTNTSKTQKRCSILPISCNDIVCFKSKPSNIRGLKKERILNKLFNRNLCDCNLEKLEGVQNGLKSFEGLSIKQVAVALTDLHSINLISGCSRHCLHCYANAQPFLKKGSYEDLKQICDDIKELGKRTGAKPCHHHGSGYINVSFDADALDCHLFDKKGEKHDYIDIAKLIYNATGYKPVFDTNGWDTPDKQKVAEDYVKKLLEDNNYKNFYQINISINPFNPKYVKALKSGYPIDDLYRPFKKIIINSEYAAEGNTPKDLEKARELYTTYVTDTVKILLMFKPLIKTGQLDLIIRTLSDDIKNMPGYKTEDFAKTLGHIYNELRLNHMFGKLTEKELKYYGRSLGKVSNRVFTSGRMEKFYKVSNNGKLDGIEKIDKERQASKERLEKIRTSKKLSSGNLRYLKMISPDGRVYLYDNYSIIPTDIKLKTSVENTDKPFQIKMEDFKLTENMFDLI